MSKLNDKDYIENIHLAYIRINYYLSGMTESEFNEDPKTRDAISYCLLKLGKSISALSIEIRDSYNGFPSIIGLYGEMNNFSDEELWEMLNNSEFGVLQYSDFFNNMYEGEINGKKKTKNIPENKKVEYVWDYKYPIRTKSSIWTVKKK